MPVSLSYADAYLTAFVTEDREDRAFDYVDELAGDTEFPAPWRDNLTILRAYVIACLECQASPDDLFASKLKNYSDEFDALLPQAKAAQAEENEDVMPPVFSIPIERA